MSTESVLLGTADTVRGIFGEEVIYLPAAGGSLTLRGIVERSPRTADLGDAGTPRNSAEVLILRSELVDVVKGRDRVRIKWHDGTVRDTRVQSIEQTSRGFWRLGVTL